MTSRVPGIFVRRHFGAEVKYGVVPGDTHPISRSQQANAAGILASPTACPAWIGQNFEYRTVLWVLVGYPSLRVREPPRRRENGTQGVLKPNTRRQRLFTH